jgi:hypothetical protein
MSRNNIELHTNDWVLRFEENDSGDAGYFCFFGPGGILTRRELSGPVARSHSEKEARKCSRWIQKKFGVDAEHIQLEEIVHEKVKSCWLSDGDDPDGISVELSERDGKRFLYVCDSGEGFTGELDENMADALVRVLDKINHRLPGGKRNNQ